VACCHTFPSVLDRNPRCGKAGGLPERPLEAGRELPPPKEGGPCCSESAHERFDPLREEGAVLGCETQEALDPFREEGVEVLVSEMQEDLDPLREPGADSNSPAPAVGLRIGEHVIKVASNGGKDNVLCISSSPTVYHCRELDRI